MINAFEKKVIRGHMKKRGIKTRALAAALELSFPYVQHILCGSLQSRRMRSRLARFFGLPDEPNFGLAVSSESPSTADTSRGASPVEAPG